MVLSSVATSLSPCLSQSSVSRQDSKVAEEEDGDRLIDRLAVPQLPTRDQVDLVPVFASCSFRSTTVGSFRLFLRGVF